MSLFINSPILIHQNSYLAPRNGEMKQINILFSLAPHGDFSKRSLLFFPQESELRINFFNIAMLKGKI